MRGKDSYNEPEPQSSAYPVHEPVLRQEPQDEVTNLLHRWQDGDQEAGNRLWPIIQPELKKISRAYLKKERTSPTLQTNDLLNEAYLKLVQENLRHFENRLHFFGIAAKVLRQILVDRARKKMAQKRGSGEEAYTLREGEVVDDSTPTYELLELDQALIELEKLHPNTAKIIELRFIAGLKIEEIMVVLRTSRTTVNRKLQMGRRWLKRYIQGSRKYNF